MLLYTIDQTTWLCCLIFVLICFIEFYTYFSNRTNKVCKRKKLPILPDTFQYIGEIGNVLYYKTTIQNLLEVVECENIKVWAFNRNIDQEWIDAIKDNFETEKVTGSFKLCKATNSDYFYLIDGQHRIKAYANIEENFEVCVEIYRCDSKEQIQDIFFNVNCSKPLLDDDKANLAITNTIIQKLSDIYCVTIDTQRDGCKSGNVIWTNNSRRYPYIWITDLKPKLQRLLRELERINSAQLVELIQKVNTEYRLLTIQNIPNVRLDKFTTKGKKGYSQAKNIVKATGCYLGIDKNMSWIDRVKQLYYELYIE